MDISINYNGDTEFVTWLPELVGNLICKPEQGLHIVNSFAGQIANGKPGALNRTIDARGYQAAGHGNIRPDIIFCPGDMKC